MPFNVNLSNSLLLKFCMSANAEYLEVLGRTLPRLNYKNISFCNITTNVSVLQGCLKAP